LGIGVVKCGQPLVDRGVGDVDLLEALDLPELLPVAQFDQREPLGKVMVEGAFEDQRIGGKIIGPAPVAAMGVGKKNKPGIGSGGEMDGLDLVSLQKDRLERRVFPRQNANFKDLTPCLCYEGVVGCETRNVPSW